MRPLANSRRGWGEDSGGRRPEASGRAGGERLTMLASVRDARMRTAYAIAYCSAGKPHASKAQRVQYMATTIGVAGVDVRGDVAERMPEVRTHRRVGEQSWTKILSVGTGVPSGGAKRAHRLRAHECPRLGPRLLPGALDVPGQLRGVGCCGVLASGAVSRETGYKARIGRSAARVGIGSVAGPVRGLVPRSVSKPGG